MAFSSVLGASSVIKPGVCTSTTRPASPYDGQVIYETDTNLVKAFDGTAFVTVGPSGVVQVKSTTKTDTFTMSSTTYADVTGLSVSITPTSASNKILVLATLSVGGTINSTMQILRDSTAIGIGDAGGTRTRATQGTPSNTGFSATTCSGNFLDSPTTTAATVYKIQIRGTAAGTVAVNRQGNDGEDTDRIRSISTITVMEVTT